MSTITSPLSETRIDFLKTLPLLRGLSPEEINKFNQCIRPRIAKPSDILFKQGDTADGAYIIRQGQLDVELVLSDESVHTLTRLNPGRMVGELCLIENSPRSMRVRVWTMADLLFVDRVLFQQLRARQDPAAYKVIRNILNVMCGRLRTTNQQIRSGISELDAEPSNVPLSMPRPREPKVTDTKEGAFGRLRRLLVGR